MSDREQPGRHDDATISAASGDATSGEAPGAWIGPYRLLQPIGEGGFGTVFLAEQTEPIRRRVALKIIKLGMDTRQVVARFEQERQALALMDHPGIARVLDAGATSTGRPYFVMELVDGEPVSDHADHHRLDIRARLELLAAVCLAVQHAHTKGVIHRDLKPSNILVGRQDDRAVAKVIDFGIAKATDARLTERTIDTRPHHFVGTPSYMSPEQAAGSLDIDTRTDVYALGVVLYELLTGSPPFDATTLRSASYAEIQRIIHEVEPPTPSARLGRLTRAEVDAIATRRSTDPARLLAAVRGELDWIVMKALEKDRTRRYESAGALAADLGHYLAHEPVVAAPPGAVYRLRKFVRRHRGAVAAGAAVTVALVLGLAGFAWQADVAGRQRDRALEAEDSARSRAEDLALVAEFQASMLAQVDPAEAGRHLTADVTRRYTEAGAQPGEPADARQARAAAFTAQWEQVNATDAAVALIDQTILRPSADAIASRFADQPAVAARLRQTLADRYRAFGLYDDAMPLQTAALADRRALLGDDDPATLISISRMGILLMNQGRLDEAEQSFREAVDRTPRVLGPDHGESIDALTNLGVLLEAQGRLDEAEPLLRDALAARRRAFGDDDPGTPIAIGNLGYLLESQGKLDEAEPLYREALAESRRLRGEDDAFTLAALGNLGAALHAQGRLDEAEPHYREALSRYRRVAGEDHPATLTALNNLGALLKYQGKLDEAEASYREVLEKRRRTLGADHPAALNSLHNLGTLLVAAGRTTEAERALADAADRRRRALGPAHPATMNSIIALGGLLQEVGRHADAVALLAGAEGDARTTFGDTRRAQLARLLMNLGNARAALGARAQAIAHLSEARSIFSGEGASSAADAEACTQALMRLGFD